MLKQQYRYLKTKRNIVIEKAKEKYRNLKAKTQIS